MWSGGKKGGNQAIVAGECKEKGVGKGDRANTPHIPQLKTKTSPARYLVNPCPGLRPGVGAASHLILTHSSTPKKQTTRSGRAQGCKAAHVWFPKRVSTRAHTYTCIHTQTHAHAYIQAFWTCNCNCHTKTVAGREVCRATE